MRRDEFEQKAAVKVTPVTIGADVYHIKSMTAGERVAFEERSLKDGEVIAEEFYPELLARTLCDEDGTRWYADDEAGRFKSMAAGLIHRLAEAAMAANALGTKAMEEARGN